MDALAQHAELMIRVPTAAEFMAVITIMDKELVATRARLIELEKVEATGGGELSEIRSSIADCHTLIGSLEKAIEDAARRRRSAARHDEAIDG